MNDTHISYYISFKLDWGQTKYAVQLWWMNDTHISFKIDWGKT